MTSTPSLKTLADRYVKNLAKSAAAAPLKPTIKPPTVTLGGNSGVAQIPSLVQSPKIPTLSTKPISTQPQLGESQAQQVQQTAQNLKAQPQQQQQAPAPAPQGAPQQPVQPQAPPTPTGPLGVPVMSKTGFLGHWAARSQGPSGAEALTPSYVRGDAPWYALAKGVEAALGEDGRGNVKLGSGNGANETALVLPKEPRTSALFKQAFEQRLTANALAPRMLRQWHGMGLRGVRLVDAIKTAAAQYPELRAEFLKLADNSPLKMDPGTSPLKTDGPAAPKLDTTPKPPAPPAGAPKVVAPTQPAPAPAPAPTPKPEPKLNPGQTPPPGYTPPPVPVGADKPAAPPGVLGGEAKVEPDYSGLNSAYGNADTAYQQAHANWMKLYGSQRGSKEEADAWAAIPGLKEKVDAAHAAREPYMGPEYAADKATAEQAGAAYDKLIREGVPSTDPRYQAAMQAYQAAQAKMEGWRQKGLTPPTPVQPGAAKPSPEEPDPFAEQPEQPDPNAYQPGTAPRWSNMFQKAPGQDLPAMGNHQPVKDLYQQWNNPEYRNVVTTGLREKFLPWMQQTGGAGLDEWTKALDPHQRTTVRLGLSEELVRVQKDLTAATAWAKDPNQVKEYEKYRGVILDPQKRSMFDGYVKTVSDYKAAEAAWMDRYKQGVDDPNLRQQMVAARQAVDKLTAAGVDGASHHWYQQVKKAGELTAAKQSYQQAYAQVNYAEFGSAAPVDLKAGLAGAEQRGPTGQVDFRTAMRGTERQRAAYLAGLDYDTYRKELEEDAKVEADAEATRRAGQVPSTGGDTAAKWQQSRDKIYQDTLKAKLAAIPDEAQFYHGRNLVIQHALQDPNSAQGGVSVHSPKGWQDNVTAGWFRPKVTKRVMVKPQVNYPRGGVKEQAVYKDEVTDHGLLNPYQKGSQHFYDRFVKPVAGQTSADVAGYSRDAYAQRAGASSWAAGFAKADDATRGAYADRMTPTDRTMLVNDLMRTAQASAAAGDTVGAENARQAAVYLTERFNKQLAEFKANPHNVNLMEAWKANGGQWSDRGVPKPIQDHMASLNPAMRGYVGDIADSKAMEYYRGLREANDPRYKMKYDPALGYEWVDRTVLNAGAMMAPVYRTAARGVGAVTGDGPGRDWLGGDTAQLKFIMDNPDKAHLIDWSGKPGEISNKLEDVVLDAGLTGLTLLPVGAAANMGRGTGMMLGGLGGSSAAMAGVEMAPIDQKYKAPLRVVAGIAGGLGGGSLGGATVGAGQRAVQAYASTAMVRTTTNLAKVEGEVAQLTAAGKPIPADLAAKQTALRTELDTMRAAGGEKLVVAENAQKAALERVAALEARMKDVSLSPAFRRQLASSPEYKDAVKALRTAERDLYGVYKGLDKAKATPPSAAKPAAGVADDVASGKPAPGTPGNPYSLDDAVAGATGAAPEAGKTFLQRWSSGWTDPKAWREGIDRWTKGLSPEEVLKRRAQSTAGPVGTGISNLNLSYNAERLINQGLQKLPEWLSRPANAAFRTVATPFRFATGEGAFYNAFRGFKGRTGAYGTAPFLPYVGNKLDESRVKKPELTPGNLVASFMPWTNWPAQFGTTIYDKLTGAKPGTGVRDPNMPTLLDEWGNNFKALGVTKDTLADLAQGSETAKIKMRRAGEELPSFFKNKAMGVVPGANTPDQQINMARTRLADLEAKFQAATSDEEKLQLQGQIDNEKSIIETNKNQREARPTGQLRSVMALEDRLTELKQQQAALVQQHGEAAKQMPQFQKLQGDIDYVQKEYDKADLNQKEKEWVGRERRDLDQYKAILDRTGGPPTKAELDPKYQFPDTMDGRQRRAAVEAWKAKTSATHPALSALGGAQPGSPAGPTGPEPFTPDEYTKFEGDYHRALATGDTAGAKKVFDAALARAGGDTSKLPMEMMVKDMDHSMFPGMQPEQFGAMIDQGLGAGTHQKFTAAQAEVTKLAQQINQLEAAGQPIPPELQAQFQKANAPYMELRQKVQGQALAHYENTVMKDLRETQVPQFQKEYDEIKKLMAARPPGAPLDPDTQARLVAMRERGTQIAQQYTDFAMRKAVAQGGFKEDGTPIKSVQDFLGEANKTKPVLGADGQPVMQLVRQPDGSVVQQPVTEPATPIGQEIKSRIDADILQRIQGQQTGVDAQGRPVMEQHVPPEIGAGIFGNMNPMEKMLTFGGLSLGMVGLMGAMFGFGGAWLPILGLLGAAFGGHKMTGGDFGKLFKKDYWLNATKSQASRNTEVLNRFADASDSFTGSSPMGQVSLTSLRQLPQYNDLVAGKLPARQAVQYLAALQPQDRAKLQAELTATQPGSPLLPMIKQVDTFHANRQGDLAAEKAMGAPPPAGAPPGRPPKPGAPATPPAGVSKATSLDQFAAESGIPMQNGLPDLAGKTPEQIGQMVARMPGPLRAEAATKLNAFVLQTVEKKLPGATPEQAWKAVEAAAGDPDDPNYAKARQAVQMRKLLTGR